MTRKISLLVTSLAIMMSQSACGLVDAPAEIDSEPTITRYYFNFSPGSEYTYTVEDKKYSDTPYALSMKVEGAVYGCTYDTKQIYSCDWYTSAYSGTGNYYRGFYAVNADSAYYMGGNQNPETPVWLDLVAPIEKGREWSFAYGMDPDNIIKAKIEKTGLTAALPDSNGDIVTFENVIQVTYTSREDRTVKWFARDQGMLAEWKYNNLDSIVHEKLLLSTKAPD